MWPACVCIRAWYFVSGGAPGQGWTAYPSLASSMLPHGQGFESPTAPNAGVGQILWLVALLLVGVSSMMGSVNYITTIINMRAPGMTLFRMPMTIWAMFITPILQAFALPVLTVALFFQTLDKTLGTTFFLPDGLTLGNWSPHVGGGHPLL